MQVNQATNSLYYDERPQREPVKNLDKNAFLQLMIAQLRYQDPTSPMDTNKFVEQMSTFTTLEQITNLNSNFEKLFTLQQFSYATSLMNCEVTILQGENLITGEVKRVSMDSMGVRVWVNDIPYGIEQISSVEKAPQQQQGEGGTTGGNEQPSGEPGSDIEQTANTE